MAKALYGHMATSDARLVAEVRRLRIRVMDLEAELTRMRDASMPDGSVVISEMNVDLREPTQV